MRITQLNDQGRQMWDQKARFWDKLHGERGNLFHRRLVEPALLSLLKPQPGERMLDVACGNGVVARRLAADGVRVTAIDFSAPMIELAQERGSPGAVIDYRVGDATDESGLLELGISQYDAVVSTMALMDMPAIAPLFAASRQLLRDGGRLVFVTMHPAFNSNNPVFIHEKEDRDGSVSEYHALRLRYYLDMPPVPGSGAPDEPTPHLYYHRSLSQLLQPAFAAGFALDALLEPAFMPEDAAGDDELNWTRFTQFPPLLACRLR